MSQWQELELQALIFRYMLAGAAVPPELLQPIKRSLLHSQFFFQHHLQHYPACKYLSPHHIKGLILCFTLMMFNYHALHVRS